MNREDDHEALAQWIVLVLVVTFIVVCALWGTKQVINHLREAAEQFLLTADILEGKGEAVGISTHQPHLVGGPKVRQMTSAGRRAIAQAQKDRWARQRKTA